MGNQADRSEATDRLIRAGRALLLRGDTKFTVTRLCADAGMPEDDFARLFGTKAAFFRALIAPPDTMAERRLREMEITLTALEQRFQKSERDHALAVARLEKTCASPSRGKSPAKFLAPLLDAAGRQVKRISPRLAPRAAPAAAMLLVLALAAGLPFLEAARVSAAGRMEHDPSAAPAASIAALKSRAESGDVKAQSALALAYLDGSRMARDPAEAAHWAEAAATQGDADAQYLIGSLNLNGSGVARDPRQAFTWFLRSASAGNLKAMHNLAIAYVQGIGTAKNAAQGADWFARAASRGYVDSAFDLAVLYEQGLGVQQDAQQALHWYRVAANAGDKSAAARAHLLETDGQP